MRDLVVPAPTSIRTMSPEAIDRVRVIEAFALSQPQVRIITEHTFHAGMYARTIRAPAGTMITGALIKVETLLILQGDALVYVGEDSALHCRGYTVLRAAAGRKQAFVCQSDTWLTMIYPTAATTVDEVERDFTDEFDLLLSRAQEAACLE